MRTAADTQNSAYAGYRAKNLALNFIFRLGNLTVSLKITPDTDPTLIPIWEF